MNKENSTERKATWALSSALWIVIFATLYIYPFAPYLTGFNGMWGLLILREQFIFGTLLGLFLISLGVILFVFLKWRPPKTNSQRMLRKIYIGVLVYLFIGLPFYRPWYIWQTRGFAHAMNSVADVSSIRKWAESLNIPSNSYLKIDYLNRPPSIQKLDPFGVKVYAYNKNEIEECITQLLWFARYIDGRWGLIVGPESMLQPQISGKEYIQKIRPGVFVFHDLTPEIPGHIGSDNPF